MLQSMIRHTKNAVLGGDQVLELPPKTEEDVAGRKVMLWMKIRIVFNLTLVSLPPISLSDR